MPDAAIANASTFAVENADFERLDDSFQRFVEFWYRHRGPSGERPHIGALDQPDAPMMWMDGGVLVAEQDGNGRETFRFLYAAEEVCIQARSNIEGRSYADLMSEHNAAKNDAICSRILRSDRPHFLCVESEVENSKPYLLKRILAPFADDRGQPAFLAGQWHFVSI